MLFRSRNTRVVDIIDELQRYGINVDVHDTWADAAEAREEYGLDLIETPQAGTYDGVMLAVAHDVFRDTGSETIVRLCRGHTQGNYAILDIKGILGKGVGISQL